MSNELNLLTLKQCRGCHAPAASLQPCLQMDPMPLAGQFCVSAAEAADATPIPLSWVRCADCGLVQVFEDVDERVLFRTYNYASSTVSGLVRHFQGFAAVLAEAYRDRQPRFLEIGCNDGVLIRQLPTDWEKMGVDPSDVAQTSWKGSELPGYTLVNEPFSAALVRKQQWEGKWDVISGSNCLAHISDIRDVFEGVSAALCDGGEFWVEVHDLDALLAGFQWETIYHEHKAEWSLESLSVCLARLGFERIDFERIPMHGGALRCRFRRVAHVVSTARGPDRYREPLAKLADAYNRRYEHPVVQTLRRSADAGNQIAAYGAAGRANVYLNQLSEVPFAWIADESPLRKGKFLPCVGTPIVDAARLIEDQPHECLITAWNYKDDIIRKNPGYRGAWLTAFSFTEESG